MIKFKQVAVASSGDFLLQIIFHISHLISFFQGEFTLLIYTASIYRVIYYDHVISNYMLKQVWNNSQKIAQALLTRKNIAWNERTSNFTEISQGYWYILLPPPQYFNTHDVVFRQCCTYLIYFINKLLYRLKEKKVYYESKYVS